MGLLPAYPSSHPALSTSLFLEGPSTSFPGLPFQRFRVSQAAIFLVYCCVFSSCLRKRRWRFPFPRWGISAHYPFHHFGADADLLFIISFNSHSHCDHSGVQSASETLTWVPNKGQECVFAQMSKLTLSDLPHGCPQISVDAPQSHVAESPLPQRLSRVF